MAYETLSQFGNSSEGVHILFLYVANIVPIFIPMLLFAFFSIICFGSFFVQQRLTGRGDFPSSFAVAGFVTSVLAVIASLIPNLINIQTIIITIVISLVGVLWLFLSRDR